MKKLFKISGAKVAEKLKYQVAISKVYFPEELWPSVPEGFYDYVEVVAFSREDAAKLAWIMKGDEWLSKMNPRETKLPRIVSLNVNDPKAGIGGLLGRLEPVKVYKGD
jgi:hypothetical protein